MVNKMGQGLDQDWATCASHAQLAAWYEDACFGSLFKNIIAQLISLKLINTVKKTRFMLRTSGKGLSSWSVL